MMTTDIRTRRNRWRLALWGLAAGLLTVPLIAMQFTAEVNWTPLDFVAAGVMIFGTLGAYEVATRMAPNLAYRAAAAMALGAALLMTWANLAVGIIGSEDNPANLMFFGILGVGLVGTLVARFRAGGMAATLVAMAVAQALVGAVAWTLGSNILPVTGVLVAIWLTAAALFRKAAKQERAVR